MEAVKNPNDTLNPKFTSSKISKILPVKVKKPSEELYLVVLAVKHPEGKKGFSVAGSLSEGENSGVYCHATIAIRFVVTATDRIVKHNTCDIIFDLGSIYTSVDDSLGWTDFLTLERE